MTRRFMRLLVPALAALALADGCACEDAYGVSVASCVELEQRTDDEPFNGVPASITGTVVDVGEAAAFDGVALGVGGCGADAIRHSFAVDPGGGAQRMRFAWGHDDVGLDVALAGDLTVTQIAADGWAGGFSFVVRDDDGLALAVNGANSLRDVGDAHVEHGFWRGSTPTACGIASATGTRITAGDASHDVSNGDDVVIAVDGVDMRFHAFATSALGPPWVCTDAINLLSWALVRDAT